MDDSLYRVAQVCGVTYRYLRVAASNASLPTLLFLHGCPSTSYDWRHQVPYFQEKGYGLIVPDLLGYAGTDAPDDAGAYAAKLYCDQLAALLDVEGVDKAVAIGHDWGSFAVSRLANYHPDRFSAVVFIAVGYMPPQPDRLPFPIDEANAQVKAAFGYETLGYWKLLGDEQSVGILNAHVESLLSLVYAEDPALWKEHLCPTGKLEEWLLADKRAPLAAFITPEEQATHRSLLLQKGIAPPMNWYRCELRGVDKANLLALPAERSHIKQPTLICTCTKDAVARPEIALAAAPLIADLTINEFQAGHWLPLEDPDGLNKAIDEFIRIKVLATVASGPG